jgi:PadR family transcriptional regulator PadR
MSQEGGIGRELKRGTLEMILLRLLADGEMYGYQIVSALEERIGEQLQLKEGTLYPVLYRLEGAGLVGTRWETLERGVPRKYYRLTETGVAQLRALVEEWRAFVTVVDAIVGAEGVRR